MKKNFKNKFVTLWRVTTRCFLIIATVLALLFVTINIGKVTVTQFRLGWIYQSIQEAENSREYYSERAQNSGGMIGSYYQSQADSQDKEVEYLTQKRYSIQHSDDAIVAWAAKDGFEHAIFWPSLLAMLAIAGVWVLWYKNLISITNAEEWIFGNVIYAVFKAFSVIFFFVGGTCLGFADINKRKKPSREKANRKHTQHRKSSNGNIVRFNGKKRRRLG